ncbi:RNA polymerase sigma-70 factor, ECF subfamily [Brevinema andersonii]|uniref:RNA polymerase sigma-70 factor, ECF subfamily n=1 Tax=Brevinema andersonii TaxID=34097 RepID=A0A1I1D9C4_BREAD|nr:sigma-70 family RNA polymerase sigma factor [Brevinema andersonii]SFB71535.1 RNA polymerase sigma-70 factor, ECF subfamily [Brevinema andersonii]
MVANQIEEITELEIQNAIERVKDGDNEAFSIIYEAYYKMVVSILRRILKLPMNELDAYVNEAFLLIYKGLKGFKGDAKFSTYAYRIVLNYAFKVSKKRAKDKKNIAVFGENEEGIETIPDSGDTESSVVVRSFLDYAIGSLTKDMQEVIDLYYYERYPIKEIASMLNTTETAIKNRLYQARSKIKKLMTEGVYHA